MPVFFNKVIENEIHLLIWEINENENDLRAQVTLTADDYESVAAISNSAKRIEYLAGKAALESICKLNSITYKGIVKDEHGKPSLIESIFEMSISHSKKFVAVVLRKKHALGVDIEFPQQKMFKIMHRVFSEKEVKLCENNLELTSIFWSAKEALYKLYGKRKVDFKENMFLYFENKILYGKIKMPDYESVQQIYIEKIQDFILVIAY